jgi:hypothetical protein
MEWSTSNSGSVALPLEMLLILLKLLGDGNFHDQNVDT